MSRIGRAPIHIPAGVTVTVGEDNLVYFKGPLGISYCKFPLNMKIKIEDGVLTVTRPSDNKSFRSLHALIYTIINKMFLSVTQGFTKNLAFDGEVIVPLSKARI